MVTPDGRTLYVADILDDTVSVISLKGRPMAGAGNGVIAAMLSIRLKQSRAGRGSET